MNETERVSADLMKWQLGIVVEGEKYRDYSFPLEQFGGVNVGLPNTLTVNHPLNTEKDAVHYVARLGQVSTRMDEAIAEARGLVAKNMIPPRFIIRATIAQMRQFIATPPSENPFVASFAQRMALRQRRSRRAARRAAGAGREDRRRSGLSVVEARRSRCFSRSWAARPTMRGCGDSRAASEAYACALRRYTTTNLTADQIHEIGLKQVAAIEKQMDDVMRQIGRTQGSDQGTRRRS